MVADVGVHRRAVALGNVGRIRDDEVESASENRLQPSDPVPPSVLRECVGPAEVDPGPELAAILRGHFEGLFREVGGRDFGFGKFQRQ